MVLHTVGMKMPRPCTPVKKLAPQNLIPPPVKKMMASTEKVCVDKYGREAISKKQQFARYLRCI